MAAITKATGKLCLTRQLVGRYATQYRSTLSIAWNGPSFFFYTNSSINEDSKGISYSLRPFNPSIHNKPFGINSRYFSSAESASDAYYKQKIAQKQLRTQRYNERQEHKEIVKRRRDGRARSSRRKRFDAWFKPKQKMESVADSKAKKLGMDWKIHVSVVLERLPVVLPDSPQWEEDYTILRDYLDQFGRDYPPELFGKMEIEEMENLTTEAMLEHLPKGYTPAPRETEADASGDVRTLDRKLKTWLYLTVQEPLLPGLDPEGQPVRWQLPTVALDSNETLLDGAKRAIREKVGDSMDIYYPSNCPMAVDMRVFRNEERKDHNNTYGIKTFYMVVQYDEGTFSRDNILVDDFAWLEKSEVLERVSEEQGKDKAMLYQYLLSTDAYDFTVE